jgi:outer membrane protein TolC
MAWQSFLRRGFWAQLGVVLAFVPCAALAQQQSAYPAALPEDLLPGLRPLLEAAMKESPTMLSANLTVATADANAIVDRSGLFPSLSGYGQYVSTQEAISSNTSSSSTTNGPLYGLSFAQPIFQWGALKNQAAYGKLRSSIARRQYAEAYRALSLSVRAQYLALIEKKITLRNSRNVEKNAADTLTVQEERFRNGRISSAEITEPRLQVQEAQIGVDKAQEDYDSSRRMLAHLVGLQNIEDSDIPDDIPKPTFAPETTASFFTEQSKHDPLENNVLLQTYKDTIKEDELTYKIQKVRLLPKFNVFVNYTQQNETNVTTVANADNTISRVPVLTAITVTTIGVGANWTIFDGFATRGAVRSALAAKRLAERQMADYSANTADALMNLQKQIGFAGRLMDLTETRRALAVAAIGKVQNDVKNGVSPQSLLNAVSQNADTATLTAVSARADFLSRWAEYLSLAGVDPVLDKLPSSYFHHVQ